MLFLGLENSLLLFDNFPFPFVLPILVSRLEIRIKMEYSEDVKICVISGFRREVDENCGLLGYYVANSGKFLFKGLESRKKASRPSTGFI
jgi:hypothetical protein